MKTNLEQPWIEVGYSLFSQEGPAGLKIDQLAKQVGISRSSFYHHFADLEVFQEKLLNYHLERAKYAAAGVRECKSIDPDFLLLMVREKEYVLFNRQLRIHRSNKVFKKCFEDAALQLAIEVMGIWSETFEMQTPAAKKLYKMTQDIFFHRLTLDNLTYEWLKDFLEEMKLFIRDVK